MPADLGESRGDLGQSEPVTSQAFWNAERDDAAVDERIPAVVPPECRGTENPDHLMEVMNWIGMDRIMFSSDYPHWDFDDPFVSLPPS